MKLRIEPLTISRWTDFEKLFGEKGACGGCWCMLSRLSRQKFESQKGAGNKRAMKALVKRGVVPGVLAYLEDEAVAWCAIAPRDEFPLLDRSRTLKRIDDQPVWSIVCLYLDKRIRKQGYSRKIIEVAVKYARTKGAKIVEAYPFNPPKTRLPDAFVWTGLTPTYEAAGFKIAAERSKNRPVMRRYLR
jgi:GNAT superfamily N-acetyltransferase